ncbi:unnamed protein product [Polarella glacialis]|uniref:peptidyl-tRNA hydrolase n=1 Tax=Polarella glacialis TaxID=89957 RepID=A0A813FYL0_POLGL|nr:unnamed protein product [Polarella glacialis]
MTAEGFGAEPAEVASTSGPLPTMEPTACHGTAADKESSASAPVRKDPLVMYVMIRKDLDWPMGALMNQACHASSAVTWEAREDTQAVDYFSEVEGQMTTMTMGAADEVELRKVAEKLFAAGFPARLWVEQPEGVASALATWPRRRSELQKFFKGIKRF